MNSKWSPVVVVLLYGSLPQLSTTYTRDTNSSASPIICQNALKMGLNEYWESRERKEARTLGIVIFMDHHQFVAESKVVKEMNV